MAVRRLPLWPALMAALLLQLGMGWLLRPLRPALDEMPPAPSPASLTALALGDTQFLFRLQTLWLQDFGDGGGRIKPLRDYDYDRVVAWLSGVDTLDPRSDMTFQLGSHYFGALTDPGSAATKVGRIAGFFEQAAMAEPARRWPWLVWAATTIQHRVKDPFLARQTASDIMRLRGASGAPDWLPLLAIPLYATAGDQAESDRLAHDPAMLELRRRALEELHRNEKAEVPH